MPITVSDVNELVRLIEANPELKRALQEQLVDAEAIQRALRDPAKRDEIRRAVLGDEWVDAPALLRELAESQREQAALLREHSALLREHSALLREHSVQLVALSETQQRHEAILQEHTRQLAMLIETQQRHEAILQEHSRILQNHTDLLMRMEVEMRSLREQFAGYTGRIEGEAYERRTTRRAPVLFNGGDGGTPESPIVRQRLREWLKKARAEISAYDDEQSDPYLADLIWWKSGNVLVCEISIKVDRLDVLRAKRRAQALRRAGVNATPVVIGTEWAQDETRELARTEGVEWIVQGHYSESMLEFRKQPDAEEAAEA
ncbi:MAG: hypothetical protein NZ874_05440 [Fimbriimonadales bacterium]|nr:hypothetical protein [Fimbriimonadales bacterium]